MMHDGSLWCIGRGEDTWLQCPEINLIFVNTPEMLNLSFVRLVLILYYYHGCHSKVSSFIKRLVSSCFTRCLLCMLWCHTCIAATATHNHPKFTFRFLAVSLKCTLSHILQGILHMSTPVSAVLVSLFLIKSLTMVMELIATLRLLASALEMLLAMLFSKRITDLVASFESTILSAQLLSMSTLHKYSAAYISHHTSL